MFKKIALPLFVLCACSLASFGQKTETQAPKTPATPTSATQQKSTTSLDGPSLAPSTLPNSNDSVTMTIFFKHQQDKNLIEIRRKLEANGFWDMFPPADARVISWNVVIGLGQIVTLKMPAHSVRNLQLALGNGAWGAYNTEVFLTYDYLPIWKDYIEKREETKDDRN